jgi:hypothetical protein
MTNRPNQRRLNVANRIAGVEFHHEHRVLCKSLPKHHDHLYKCISSDGRLNRISRTEFFRRQSVMSFADRQERLLADPPAFFELSIGQDLACESFQDDWNMFKRVKSWRRFQVGFYWLDETMIKLM